MKNEKRLQVYCPYSVLDLGWETLKKLQNITFETPWYLRRNKEKHIEAPEGMKYENVYRY